MKNKFVVLSFSLILLVCACTGHAVHTVTKTDDVNDQVQAESVVVKFYDALASKKYDQTFQYFGTPFFKIASKETLNSQYQKTLNEFGEIKKVGLISARSKTVTGNVNSGEYTLIFGVHRVKQDTYETFTLDLEGKYHQNSKLRRKRYKIATAWDGNLGLVIADGTLVCDVYQAMQQN